MIFLDEIGNNGNLKQIIDMATSLNSDTRLEKLLNLTQAVSRWLRRRQTITDLAKSLPWGNRQIMIEANVHFIESTIRLRVIPESAITGI